MEGLLAFIAFLASVFGIFYVFVTTRNKERMSLIEKGADASLFNTGKEGQKSWFNWNKATLKFGMLLMGVGVGIIAGSILDSMDAMEHGAEYTSMVFLFGGLSLVLFYLIDRKN
jgi:threonine dehydrogenase-like Zn-dependent dehydrogenase